MPRAFAEIAFTPNVRAAQARHGSAAGYEKFLSPEISGGAILGPDEAAFIQPATGFIRQPFLKAAGPMSSFAAAPRGFCGCLMRAPWLCRLSRQPAVCEPWKSCGR